MTENVRRVCFEITAVDEAPGRPSFQHRAHAALDELGTRVKEYDESFHADCSGSVSRRKREWLAAQGLGKAEGTFHASNGCVVKWHATSAPLEEVQT